MGKKLKIFVLFFTAAVLLVLTVQSLRMTGFFKPKTQGQGYQVVIPVTASPAPTQDNLQLHTFPFITTTPAPTQVPPTAPPLPPTTAPSPTLEPVTTEEPLPGAPTQAPSTPIKVSTPKIGGPDETATEYCIDDEDPDMCDDTSSHMVPKGTGGVAGTCGTVIQNTHSLVDKLPHVMKGDRNSLGGAVSTSCATAGAVAAPNYVSTMLPIDAYNLTGFKELSRSNASHVSPSGLLAWWKANPAGYKFIPYSTGAMQQYANGQQDLTGCVMFFKGGHIGVVNKFEVYTPGGDGVISILQSSYRMYIDRFPVSGYNVSNSSTNMTSTGGIEGFGCRQ